MRASLGVLVVWACVWSVGCPGDDGGIIFDGSVPDGSRPPDYRPPRCGPDGGIADADCGEGGVPPIETDAGPPPPPPPPCNEVTFTYTNASASSVWIAGSWLLRPDGQWATNPAEGVLVLERMGDAWSITTLIEPIQRHEYKVILNGTEWITDPGNPNMVPDGFGGSGMNSVIDVCAATCGDLDEFDWRDTVMYFAMVDRFYDSDGSGPLNDGSTGGNAATGPSARFEGGDLRGITERMEYLAELGVTSLWITAPFANRTDRGAAVDPGRDTNWYSAYHGYWPSPQNIAYSSSGEPSMRPRVDSRIGSESDLIAMIEAAHSAESANRHGIKVLFDYVMNHVDAQSPLFMSNPGWFHRAPGRDTARLCGETERVGDRDVQLWDIPEWTTRCAFTDYLPPFDFGNVNARHWSVSDAVWWAKEFGIDGYRLDAIKHVDTQWLRDLRSRLTSEVPDAPGDRFYLVGETFEYNDQALLASFVDPDTMLDGQFDFPHKARLCEAVFRPEGRMDNLRTFMDGNDTYYGPNALMTTWIGNHDVPRPIHFASRQIGDCRQGSDPPTNGWTSNYPQPAEAEPYERLGVAFAVLFTNPGVPLLYYGDEIGLAGGGDPDNRRMMPWNDASLNPHQRALRDRVRALGRIRGAYPVLGRGRRVTISADQDTWVYRMTGCGDDVIVAINKADAARSVNIPAGSYTDLMTEGAASGGSRELPARSFVILSPAP
ncbi:MAG: hypothetical protein KF901_18160 [Myxococcales bacterium]|nr:hypothetical protein [Myxococcales bacterium]